MNSATYWEESYEDDALLLPDIQEDLDQSYDVMYDYLCIDMLPALVMIALMIFLAGLFLIPLNLCILLLAKRLSVTVQPTLDFKPGFKV